jgi:hypothetical protein
MNGFINIFMMKKEIKGYPSVIEEKAESVIVKENEPKRK